MQWNIPLKFIDLLRETRQVQWTVPAGDFQADRGDQISNTVERFFWMQLWSGDLGLWLTVKPVWADTMPWAADLSRGKQLWRPGHLQRCLYTRLPLFTLLSLPLAGPVKKRTNMVTLGRGEIKQLPSWHLFPVVPPPCPCIVFHTIL